MKKLNFLLILGILILLLLNGCVQFNKKFNEEEGQNTQKLAEEKVNDNINDQSDNNNNKNNNNNNNNNKIEENIVRILFAGDTMMDGRMAGVLEEKGMEYPLREFMPIFQNTDLVIVNLETSVGTSGDLMEKTYAFQTNPKYFSLFESLQDKLVFSLANNHGMDGPLEESIRELNKLKYKYIGVGENQAHAFRPHVAEINGVSVAIFGVSRVIPHSSWTARDEQSGMATAYSQEPLLTCVREWSKKVDHVIVFIHWGEELEENPNEVQINLDEKLVEAGAKLIVGGHPHVIQELKWREEGQLTAYSLGNFLFTTSRHPIANDLIALEVHLSKKKIEFAKVWPGKINFGLVQNLEGGEEGQRILRRLQGLSPTIKIYQEGQITPNF